MSTSATASATAWASTIHERPGVRPRGDRDAEAGMAVTIEPGIYLEGEAGVRIEDLVILTEDGSEVLSQLPEGLRTVR